MQTILDNLILFVPSFLITVLVMPFFIRLIIKQQRVAKIRKLGPDHAAKAGTPSMGGAVFVSAAMISIVISTIVQGASSKAVLFPLLSFFAFGLIGFADDFIKVLLNRDEGFRFIPKLIAQILAALSVGLLLYYSSWNPVFVLPRMGTYNIGWALYLAFLIFWFVGWSNATNFTDGLDGLLTGVSIIAYAGYFVMAVYFNNQILQIVDGAVIGALIGFLIFNKPKAKIFMGDVGSLSLGAGLAMNSILIGQPLSLLWIGLVFVIETLSIIIQITGYRLFHKRIFPMTPIHHSFEKIGWSEIKIDFLFWGFQLLITVIGISGWLFIAQHHG